MSKLDTLEPTFKAKAVVLLDRLRELTGLTWICTSGRRTISQQDLLYAQGRSIGGPKVTNAKGGQSPHNFGLALDVAPYKNSSIWWNAPDNIWHSVGIVAKELGLVWGGDFKSIRDLPHVEDPSWKEVQLAWKEGKIKVA